MTEADDTQTSSEPPGVLNTGPGTVNITGSAVGSAAVVVGEVILGGALAPFAAAFCTELGRRFGGSTADWISRVRLRRRPHNPAATDLLIEAGGSVTALEVGDDLTEDAKLALLDLDIEDPEVRGHRMIWNTQLSAWVAVDIEA